MDAFRGARLQLILPSQSSVRMDFQTELPPTGVAIFRSNPLFLITNILSLIYNSLRYIKREMA